MDPNVADTAPSLTSHSTEASSIATQSAQNTGTGVPQPQETVNGPTIVGDLSLDQMWWRKREWIFLREQFEDWLIDGEWHDWLWKLKFDPCGGVYPMPISVREALYPDPPFASEFPSYEELLNWHFLDVLREKFDDHVYAKLEEREPSLTKLLGKSWTEYDWGAMRDDTLALAKERLTDAEGSSEQSRALAELVKLIEGFVKTMGLPTLAPRAQEQEN